MISEEQKFKDNWENMVSICCEKGNHIARRLPIQAAESRTHVLVVCEQCGHGFDWPVPESK